ncbi:MAG: hypothetical protein QF521_25330, partial [Alphaproteobacteria bacterium]|jgi:hypothetical protein|nr:hypothetical protein [Alphaproteobacteria bacterium]
MGSGFSRSVLPCRIIARRQPALEQRDGEEIGRDPRRMTTAELIAVGHARLPLSKAVRRFCIECSGGSMDEARKCVAVDCVLWPFRMGTNPWRPPLSDDERERRAKVLEKSRRYGR